MSRKPTVSRRDFVASGMTAGAAAVWGSSSGAESAGREPAATAVRPLAQEYTIVGRVKYERTRVDYPALVRLPSGRLLCTYGYDGRWDIPGRQNIKRSSDEGKTWEPLPSLEMIETFPFVHQGRLYLLGNGRARTDAVILRSNDEGETWSPPVTLFRGDFWNAPTGYVIREGTLYRAYDGGKGGRPLVVIAGDLSKELMDPKSWRISNRLEYPGTPKSLRKPGVEYRDHWLEPNVVCVRGRMMVLARCRIAAYTTVSIAAVADLNDDGGKLDLRFTQFYPVQAAQQKFYIFYDEPSRLYWMTGNLVADPQNSTGWAEELAKRGFRGPPGNSRRNQFLFYSIDALNWFQAGCVAMSKDPLQSFMYSSPLVAGDDLLLAVRTASKDAPNQHDADLITLHRVADFRSLALDIHPEI